MTSVISEPKEVKARKRHVCNFCGQRIVPNEKYIKSTCVTDGDIYDWKAHKYCSKLSHRMNMYAEIYHHEGLTMDDFMDIVSNKHIEVLRSKLPDDCKYGDITNQLMKVEFREKLWFVIRYYNKIDEINNSLTK